VAALLAQVLAQQLAGAGIEQPHAALIPLHLTRRPIQPGGPVVALRLNTAVQVYGALAE